MFTQRSIAPSRLCLASALLALSPIAPSSIALSSMARAEPLVDPPRDPTRGRSVDPPPEASSVELGIASAQGYCEMIQGQTDSRTALLMAPELFADLGVLTQTEPVTLDGERLTRRFLRLTTGLRYSIGDLYRGALEQRRAGAECARYRTLSGLFSVLRGRVALVRRGLDARLGLLREAVKRAEEILGATRSAVEHGTATVAELHAVELWADTLRRRLNEGEGRLRVAEARAVPAGDVRALLDERVSRERRSEEIEGQLRRSLAWDLVLAVGYDQVFEAENRVPVFGSARLSFNFGRFFQGGADDRAIRGRARWSQHQVEGANARIDVELGQIQSTLVSEEERLRQVETLLADLREREAVIAKVESPTAERFRNQLWFERVQLEADRAYLAAHVDDLRAFLGGERSPARP